MIEKDRWWRQFKLRIGALTPWLAQLQKLKRKSAPTQYTAKTTTASTLLHHCHQEKIRATNFKFHTNSHSKLNSSTRHYNSDLHSNQKLPSP